MLFIIADQKHHVYNETVNSFFCLFFLKKETSLKKEGGFCWIALVVLVLRLPGGEPEVL